MSRSIVAYAAGAESLGQHFAIELNARSLRATVIQRHADTDPGSVLERRGLHAALAACVDQRADLCVATISVLGSPTAVGLVISMLMEKNLELHTLDGSKPDANTRAAVQVIRDADVLRGKVARVAVRRARDAAPMLGLRNANDEIKAQADAIKERRRLERLGLPVEPEAVGPREGSPTHPLRVHLEVDDDVLDEDGPRT